MTKKTKKKIKHQTFLNRLYNVKFESRRYTGEGEHELLVIARNIPDAYSKARNLIVKKYTGQEIISVEKTGTVDIF